MKNNNTTQTQKVVTRIAPSPTGVLHVGTARSALFNFLFAKKYGGDFIVRIEDTDKKRSTKEFEENILEGLAWLGLTYDTFARQSERTDIYRAYLEKLISDGLAYESEEESKQNPDEMITVIRLKNEGRTISFQDIVRGEVSFDTTELGNMVIARGIDDPLYHFTVVVDDFEMEVSHVIRGEDHISNTPRQILIQEALGFPRPLYAHLPLILAPDRSKLSKRHGAISVDSYREAGYLPESLINYLALLGWNPGDDREFFSLSELTSAFSLEQIQKGGAIFSTEKLDWFNAHYLKEKPKDELLSMVERAVSPELFSVFKRSETAFDDACARLSRIPLLNEIESRGEYSFYLDTPRFERDLLLQKGKIPPQKAEEHLRAVLNMLKDTPADKYKAPYIKEILWDYATKEGRGEVLWPLRTALSGAEKSPDPFTLIDALGKEEVLARIDTALNILSEV